MGYVLAPLRGCPDLWVKTRLPADALAVRLLEQHLPPAERPADLVALLQSWIDGDHVAEQQETGEYLVRVLDEDRLSDRKLFSSEMKEVTW